MSNSLSKDKLLELAEDDPFFSGLLGEYKTSQQPPALPQPLEETFLMGDVVSFSIIAIIVAIFFCRFFISQKEKIKKFWILIFLLISIAGCVFFVPYERMAGKDYWIPAGQSTIFEPPKKSASKYNRIMYSELIFRECIILASCGAGYLISVLTLKRNE